MQAWSTWSSTGEVLNAVNRVSSHDQNALSHPRAAATPCTAADPFTVAGKAGCVLWSGHFCGILSQGAGTTTLLNPRQSQNYYRDQTLPQSPMQMDKMSSSLFGLRQRFMWPLWYSDPSASSGPVLILTDWVLIQIELLTHDGTDQNLKDLQKPPVVSCI